MADAQLLPMHIVQMIPDGPLAPHCVVQFVPVFHTCLRALWGIGKLELQVLIH